MTARKPPETLGNPPETPVLAVRKPLRNPRCILWAEAVIRAKLCTRAGEDARERAQPALGRVLRPSCGAGV